MRDGHLKALQGKLELLERLCRALQKERNDLNNRLAVLKKQGDKDEFTPPEAHTHKLLTREEEDKEKDKGAQEDQCLLHHNALENEDIHQNSKLPEMEASSGTETTTAVLNISQHAKTVCEVQD